jgi:hypothetical protein
LNIFIKIVACNEKPAEQGIPNERSAMLAGVITGANAAHQHVKTKRTRLVRGIGQHEEDVVKERQEIGLVEACTPERLVSLSPRDPRCVQRVDVLCATSALAFSMFCHISSRMLRPVSAMFLIVCLNAHTTLSMMILNVGAGIMKKAALETAGNERECLRQL